MNAPLPPDATAVASLACDSIIASPSNPRKRFDEAYIAELAESIKAHGLIQPITVRPLPLDSFFEFNKHRARGDGSLPPQYEIVVGECRWRAFKLAGLTAIPAFWRELDDKQVLEIQVIENLQRRDVHPIEEAEGYEQLMQRHGYKAEEIAAKIGKSRSYIYGRLKLTALCPDARQACYAGTLSDSTALLIARIPGAALQKKALKEVVQGYNGEPLSYRTAQQHIHRRYTLSLKQANFAPDDATLLPAAGACRDCPKLSGNFRDLYDDIEDADVCTDPDCFEAKHQARCDRLIAHAEARKIPVITDPEEARKYHHTPGYVSLDDPCDEDADERTYRQILGDAAPVAALVQHPWRKGEIHEMAEDSAMEKALKKAGWTPATEAPPPPPKNETARQKAARLAQEEAAAAARKEREAERERQEAQAEADSERLRRLRTAMLARLEAIELDVSTEADGLIRALVCAWLDNELDIIGPGGYEDELRQWLGVTLPEEYDDHEVVPGILSVLDTAPLGNLVGLMLAPMTRHTTVHWSNAGTKHPVLERVAKALRLEEPASTPPRAAPAGDKSAPAKKAKPEAKPAAPKKPAAKKAKAKTDPAPAAPANEAATPPTTGGDMLAWPFPEKARP